jgi:hypothetical protein
MASNGSNGNAAAAAPPAPAAAAVDPKLTRLREAMAKADGGKGVAAYIVPTGE